MGCDSVIVASSCIGPMFLLHHERLFLPDCRLFVVLRSQKVGAADLPPIPIVREVTMPSERQQAPQTEDECLLSPKAVEWKGEVGKQILWPLLKGIATIALLYPLLCPF